MRAIEAPHMPILGTPYLDDAVEDGAVIVAGAGQLYGALCVVFFWRVRDHGLKQDA